MNMHEIRKKTGLSQARFSKKYGVPLRTVQDWELGNRTPPEYVLINLNMAVEMEKIIPMGYVFHFFDGVSSEYEVFNTENKAIASAFAKWDQMTSAQRIACKASETTYFYVSLSELSWDGDRFVPSKEVDCVWSAF